MESLLFFSIVALLSLIVIILAAKYLVDSITSYARKTGFSNYIVGFLVVAIGTALPDLSTGIMAAIAGRSELALGDAIGANILIVTLVLGLTLIIMKRYKNKDRSIGRTMYAMYFIILLPLIMSYDGSISRIDGIILVIIFFLYIFSLLKRENESGKVKESISFSRIIVDMLVFLFALGSLLLGARYLVHSSIQLSNILDIPLFFIGLVFISLANTMPEIFIGIKSAMSRHTEISFGNVFGAVAINTTLVIGISAIISPINIQFSEYLWPILFSIAIIAFASLLFIKKEINYKHGIALVAFYILYIILISVKTFYFKS